MSLPYFPFYPSDYLGDTMHLSTEEHGAYLLLLITMWQHGARLPNDPAKLARIARVPARRWAAVWGNVSEFFHEQDGDIYSPRMREEYEKATAKSAVRRTSGKAGAAAKSLKAQETPSANASGLLKHTQNSDIRDTSNEVSKARAPSLLSGFPPSVSPQRAAAFIAHRKALRRPLTAHAVTLLSKSLAECEAMGIPADAAIDLAIERGWQTVKPDWAANALTPNPPKGGPGNGQSSRPAPRQAAETERLDRLLEVGRRRDAERGSRSHAGAGERGMAGGADYDASPPLLRLATG